LQACVAATTSRIDDEHAGRLREDEILRFEQHAGVVDQDVGATELAAQACGKRGHGTRVGDVGDVRQHVVALLAQLSGGVFDRLGNASDHQHRAAGGRKLACHGQADATGGSCDDRKFLS
jgi:hypothetical protein